MIEKKFNIIWKGEIVEMGIPAKDVERHLNHLAKGQNIHKFTVGENIYAKPITIKK